MNASKYLEREVLEKQIKGKTTYVALFTTDPTDAGTGTEVSGGGYKRMQINFGSPEPSGDKTIIKNTNEIKFPTTTANVGTVSHFAIYDSITSGNMLVYGALKKPRALEEDSQMSLDPDAIVISVR